jgi:hypothetical protein
MTAWTAVIARFFSSGNAVRWIVFDAARHKAPRGRLDNSPRGEEIPEDSVIASRYTTGPNDQPPPRLKGNSSILGRHDTSIANYTGRFLMVGQPLPTTSLRDKNRLKLEA